MIKAGTCFCHKCGKLFQEAYYKSGLNPIGARLKHARLRWLGPAWEIEPVCVSDDPITPTNAPRLVSVSGGDDGIPNAIRCRFGNNDTVYEMPRCCPMCQGVDTQLAVDNGRYHTFLIAVAGGRTVGKTTWLEAISNTQNLAILNQTAAYPYKLDFIFNFDAHEKIVSTNKNEDGATNYLRIIEKSTGKIVASVVLLDAAGELYRNVSQADNGLRKFFLGEDNFPGVDGVIYLESALSHVDEIQNKEDLDNSKEAFAIYAEMKAVDALHNKPVAYVCTHTDMMLTNANKRKIPKVRDLSGDHLVPAYTKSTFCLNPSYAPRDLWPRILQQDLIARAMKPDVLLDDDGNRHGFMVQSCENRKLEDGTIDPDKTRNFNLLDPLLWILYTLGLFPIPKN